MRARDFAYLDADVPIALAHRGGTAHPANLGIENTLAAFQHAVDLGFRYLETDVHATRDGELVAFHDVSLDRVTDRDGLIKERSWAEVSQARIGGREPIPRLVDLLEAFPQARLNIDVKDDAAMAPTIDVVRAHDALDRVCLASFSGRRLRALRAEFGDALAVSAGQVGTVLMRFTPDLISRLIHTPAPVLQIPGRHRLRGREVDIVTPGLVRRAHALGKQIHVWFHPWAPQDDAEMHRLLDLGVDGLVVDDLETLRRVYAERGHTLP